MALQRLLVLWRCTRVDVPRAPRFLASVIASLHHDLRFAPDKTKRRQMDDAESLMRDIQPDQLYPLEYVVFRITRFRPDPGDHDATVVGSALVRDLGAFVQALSSDISMGASQSRGVAVGLDEVAGKLGVNRRTVQRHRGDGLALHWVRRDGERPFLGCFPDSLEHYLQRSPDGMRRIRAWNRISDIERRSILERAETLRSSGSVSLHAASVSIAEEIDRAVSSVRHVLESARNSCGDPLFMSHGPLTNRDAAVCERAHGIGIPLSRVAARFNKSVPAVHRAMLRYRKRRLQGLMLDSVWHETFDREDATQVLLEFPAVRHDLPGPDWTIDLADDVRVEDLNHGDRIIVASQLLIGRARRRLADLDGQPTVRAIDSIESDLRWAGRLRGRLLEQAIPTILKGCQQWLGRPLHELSRRAAFQLVNSCISVVWPVLEALEPRLVDRLEARCLNAVDRLLTVRKPPREMLASARHDPGDLILDWPVRDLVAWTWLEPGGRWVSRIDSLGVEEQRLVGMRWGLGGEAPHSIEAISEVRDLSWMVVQKRLHAIEVSLRTNSSESI